MGKIQITIFGILGILGNLPGIDPCRFGMNCDYPCHCQNDDVCDPLNGICPSGCDDGDLREPGDLWYTGAWTGYGCQLGNVAYNKTANHGPDPWRFPSERAIDGNHDPEMGRGSCVWPHDGDRRVLPWWQVDLGDTYVVISVRITNRNRDRRHAAFVRITVGTEENDVSSHRICHVVRGEGAVATNHVTCDAPVVGRFVRLQRFNSRGAWMINELTICEVQVYGYLYHDCPDDLFGVACGSPCSCYGPCDDINGVCSGNCLEGRMGDDCQISCPQGWWGNNCQKRCNCQYSLEICTPTNGSCASGCNTGYGGVGCHLELPVLLSVLELSSASQNTLKIRYSNWTPENGGGTQPRGYLVETRINGSMEWISSLQTGHNAMIAVYIIVLKDLKPDTSYYVRVIPFIEDGGHVYYGNATQEAGPFLTLEAALKATSTISVVVGVVLACVIGAAAIIMGVILLRRRRDQNNRSAIAATPETKEVTENGIDHVYESIEAENALSMTNNHHMYENQTPSRRPHPTNGLDSPTSDNCKRHEVFVENNARNKWVPANSTEDGYETVVPIHRDVDAKYETIGGDAVVLSGISDNIYEI